MKTHGIGALILQFLRLIGQRLPVLLLISVAAAGPYAALSARYPLLQESEPDPNVFYDPPVLLEPMMYAPRVVTMVGFAWLISFAVTVALAQSPPPGISGVAMRLRSALILSPLMVFCAPMAMIAAAVAFVGASFLGTFLLVPLAFLSIALETRALGHALVPISLAPLPYFLLRVWPLPFVLMSETTNRPIERALALTKRRALSTLLPFILLAGCLWPLNVLLEGGSVSWFLKATLQVLLNWSLPVVLALLLFSRFQSVEQAGLKP